MRIPGLFCRRFFVACAASAILTLLCVDATGQEQANSKSAKQTSAGPKWVTDDESISLVAGDELLFRYVFRSGQKPIVHPLVGPSGKTMAREYPMKPPGEDGTKDHIHQRSMWMTHGEVNDIDFWSEAAGSGTIEHVAVKSSTVDEKGVGTLVTTARWVKPDGTVLLDEHKTFRIASSDGARMIDMDVTFTAVADEVHFGDTKEGSFGIRVPDSMMVDRKQGGKIINAEGLEDGKAWGQKSRWVDYSGPVEGDMVGITILEHPESFNAPCRWHVRSYGLFAANPFGEAHFTGGKKTDGHRLAKGNKLRLSYRVVLHDGPADVAAIEKQWKQFVSAGS